MTVRELIIKVVCDNSIDKCIMINGRDVVTTHNNLDLQVTDFRIVCSDNRTKIHIVTK